MLSLSDITLREIKKNDLKMVLDWRNTYDVRKYMLNDTIISLDDHLKWYKKVSKDKTCEVLVTEYRNQPIGIIYISQLNLADQTCTWGQYIGESLRNSGIGILMQIKAIDRMINVHKIRKIWGQALDINQIIKIHEAFGFSNEGILRDHIIRYNKYINIFFVSLFADTWIKKREQLIKKFKIE